jgi:leucyl-tRNA synthetase
MLKQWFIRVTALGDDLVDGLDALPHWPEQVKGLQRAWIGRSSGACVSFPVHPPSCRGAAVPAVTAFTTRPDSLPGVTFVAVAPDHDAVTALCATLRQSTVPADAALAEALQELARRTVLAARGVGEGQGDILAVDTTLRVLHPTTGQLVRVRACVCACVCACLWRGGVIA